MDKVTQEALQEFENGNNPTMQDVEHEIANESDYKLHDDKFDDDDFDDDEFDDDDFDDDGDFDDDYDFDDDEYEFSI